MKQVLIILLAFVSFQSFSQSVKVEEIGLEVMTKDLGQMNWEEANKACADLGDGWRLSTTFELESIFRHKDKIGRFPHFYWSSTHYGGTYAIAYGSIFDVANGSQQDKNSTQYVRAVRDL